VQLQAGAVKVQWSENKTINLPGCISAIELRHESSDKNDSAKAYLRATSDASLLYLLTVERSGTLNWDSQGERLLYQDRAVYGKSTKQYDVCPEIADVAARSPV
jgi:hypothetical protein